MCLLNRTSDLVCYKVIERYTSIFMGCNYLIGRRVGNYLVYWSAFEFNDVADGLRSLVEEDEIVIAECRRELILLRREPRAGRRNRLNCIFV